MAKQSAQPLFDPRGRLLVERRGLPRELGSRLVNDAYHFMRTASWARITLLFAVIFFGLNLVFACAYYASGAVANAKGFLDCYWFSVQTIATIGYGGMTPTGAFANSMVALESFLGIGYTALATGVLFGRFATPSARILFSENAVVADYEGQRMLMFRMANMRSTAIVEATVNLYMTRDEVTASGERVRRIYDLRLARNVQPMFSISWTIYHALDETSPLHGLAPDSLTDDSCNILLTFQGIDDRLAATVHTRWSYTASHLRFDHRFVDIIKSDEARGVRYLDFTCFHDTEPVASSAG